MKGKSQQHWMERFQKDMHMLKAFIEYHTEISDAACASESMLFTWDAFEPLPFDIAMNRDGLITPVKLLKSNSIRNMKK
jgi:hypothetical protein